MREVHAIAPPPGKTAPQSALSAGFTLIEISIVLVIIGLIVGGVLVGQDLIRAAGVRATITQIEKYNQAVNTFRGKYGHLPGDICDPDATNFGFQPRGPYAGEGDGNGVIEGVYNPVANANGGIYEGTGESVMFWVDLSAAGLIEGTYNTATPTTNPGAVPINAIASYFPQAKLGQGNYIYVWSGGINAAGLPNVSNGINYFGLSVASGISGGHWLSTTPGLTVMQAHSIDQKLDDGYPSSGNVTAMYITNAVHPIWAAGGGNIGGGLPFGTLAGSSTTCYDNGSVSGTVYQYSLGQSGGAGVNCALSFQFQ